MTCGASHRTPEARENGMNNGRSSKPRISLRTAPARVCALSALLALAACGGKGSSSSSSFTVGGTISGLTTGSVVLVYNGSTSVTVAAGATTWVFPGSFPAGSSYTVSVASEPSGQLCAVTSGGSGASLTGNVSTVAVVCSDTGEWV